MIGNQEAGNGHPTTPVVQVENLVKSYGHHLVLHGISMAQQKGEAVCIIGPSGCGKSTFLRCLNQLETFLIARS